MADVYDVIGAGVGAWAGSQGTEDQTTTTAPYMFPGQHGGIERYLDHANAQYNQGGMKYYPNQTLANLDPLQIQGQNAALGNVFAQGQLGRQGAMANSALAGGGDRVGGFQLQNQIGFGIDQGLQDAVTNPIMRQLQERVMPGLDLQATQQGAFGGSRAQQMKGQASADAVGQMSDSIARANLQARQQSIGQRAGDIDAQLQGRNQDINQNQLSNQARYQALSSLPQASAGLNFGAGTMMDIGQQRQRYNQMQIDDAKNRFDFRQQEGVNNLNRLGDRLMQPSFGGQTETIEGMDGSAANIFGGAVAGYQAVDWLRNGGPAPPAIPTGNPNQGTNSDRRLKKNIQKVGELASGTNIYTWEWNEEGVRVAGDAPGFGVIAQEVDPAIVQTGPDGYLRVDYARLV